MVYSLVLYHHVRKKNVHSHGISPYQMRWDGHTHTHTAWKQEEDLGRINLAGGWELREDKLGSSLIKEHCVSVWHCERTNKCTRKIRSFGVHSDMLSCSMDLSFLIKPTHFKGASFGVWMNVWVFFVCFVCLFVCFATKPTLPFNQGVHQNIVWSLDHSSYKAEEDMNLLDIFIVICNLFPSFESH